MTRFLSEALMAPEPQFRMGLKQLELVHGNPSHDIKFSTEVNQNVQAKLKQLGLDPNDTTAKELYHVLQERIKADDAKLTKTLRTRAAMHVSAEGEVVAGMVHVLRELPDSRRCYSLKTNRLKAILKQVPPKKAMKQLGYRSLDSFLKHEIPVLALSAAWLVEGQAWQKRFLDQYKSLTSSDFETRSIAIISPDSQRWQKLSAETVETNHHNILSLKELGALVLLPLPKHAPAGTITVSLSLALHELNEIRAGSTYLQMCQVKPDFGRVIRSVALNEPHLSSSLLDRPVSWHLIQRYYARLKQYLSEEVFEPHLQLDDIAWHEVEKTLAQIEPSFDFWRGGAHLGMLHDRKPVSLNVVDAALNYCNQIAFENRIVHYFQRSLWHELLLRYLKHESVEKAVASELQPQLVTETVEI